MNDASGANDRFARLSMRGGAFANNSLPGAEPMNQNLTDLLQKKQKSAKGGGIDWDERRDKYLATVNGLYKQIESFLVQPIAQKAVRLERRKKDLTENYIGTYSVDDLILLIGDEQVRFSPRGRNIVGAGGRVDVLGERGEGAMIVQLDGQWGFVQSRQPTLKVVPLDESSFAEVLQLVMRD